jgi:hypothetical protein
MHRDCVRFSDSEPGQANPLIPLDKHHRALSEFFTLVRLMHREPLCITAWAYFFFLFVNQWVGQGIDAQVH